MKLVDTQARAVVLEQSFLETGMFGDGSDLSPTFDGTNTYPAFASTTGSAPNLVYTLTRSIFCKDMTVASGKTVNTGGYKIFCTGTLTNSGTIINAGNSAPGQTAGGALAAAELGGSGAGGAGATGTTGVGAAGSN